MAALSLMSPTWRSGWISLFLLLIYSQMVIVVFHGVFISSDEALINHSHLSVTHQHNEILWWYYILSTLVIWGLYVPVILMAFALLSMLFAAYTKDRAVFWLSFVCQAASSLLILTSIIACWLLSQLYVSWDKTLSFYICVGVQVQLVIATALTHASGRRLTSDWE